MSEEPTDDTASAASSDGSPPTIPPDGADVHPAPGGETAEPGAPPETPAATETVAVAEAVTAPTEAVEAAEPVAAEVPIDTSDAAPPAAADVAAVTSVAEVVDDAGDGMPAADEVAEEPAITVQRRGSRWRPVALVVLLFLVAIALGFATAFLVPGLADVPLPSQAALASSPPPPSAATPSATASPAPPTASPHASPSASTTPRASSVVYVVQHGDILSAIAARYGVTVAAIIAANGLKDANHIEPGQHLIIPLP